MVSLWVCFLCVGCHFSVLILWPPSAKPALADKPLRFYRGSATRIPPSIQSSTPYLIRNLEKRLNDSLPHEVRIAAARKWVTFIREVVNDMLQIMRPKVWYSIPDDLPLILNKYQQSDDKKLYDLINVETF